MITLKNNVQSLLAANVGASDTQVRVSPGEGGIFPDIAMPGEDWFRIAISDNAGNTEFLKVTGRTGDFLTVVRAEEGSAARAWLAGSRIQVRMTAKTWEDMSTTHWMRMTAPKGSVLVPTRINDTSLRLAGDYTKDVHPRRAVRFPGSATVYHIASSSFAGGNTTVVFSSGPLPASMPAMELGISQDMLPAYMALSNAVNSTSQTDAASSLAVKTAYDQAVAAANAASGKAPGGFGLGAAARQVKTIQEMGAAGGWYQINRTVAPITISGVTLPTGRLLLGYARIHAAGIYYKVDLVDWDLGLRYEYMHANGTEVLKLLPSGITDSVALVDSYTAASAKAVKTAHDQAVAAIPKSSISTAVNSTSTTTVASSSAVKAAYDLAATANAKPAGVTAAANAAEAGAAGTALIDARITLSGNTLTLTKRWYQAPADCANCNCTSGSWKCH